MLMRVCADAMDWSSTIKGARARFPHAKAWMALDVSDKGAKNFKGFDSLVISSSLLKLTMGHGATSKSLRARPSGGTSTPT
jgi:hypothetical protein